jgi:hypothetical protein
MVMNDEEKEARTFNADQQQMFGESEANQAGQPVRPRESLAGAPLDAGLEPPPRRDATDDDANEPHILAARGVSGADITGGTDKYRPGGMADQEHHAHNDTGARETGDIAGASSTHAGAGGETEPTGGVGTAPNTVGED